MVSLTKKYIASVENCAIRDVKQVGSKQLFITPNSIYSYRTRIAIYDKLTKAWRILIGSNKISNTTTKHVNYIKKTYLTY